MVVMNIIIIIVIIIEIYTKILVTSALNYANTPYRFSPLPCRHLLPLFYIIEIFKCNKMELYSVLRYIIIQSPPW